MYEMRRFMYEIMQIEDQYVAPNNQENYYLLSPLIDFCANNIFVYGH